MLYLNEKNEFYLMMDDSLYRINLGSMSVKKVVEACPQALTAHRRVTDTCMGGFCKSVLIKYHKSDGLKSGKTFEVKKGDDQYLRPLGFIGEDFIYGQANAADVVSDAAGNTTFPMNGLIILDTSDQSELKTYTFGRLCRENFCGWIYGNDRSDCAKQWCVCRNRSGYHYEPGG